MISETHNIDCMEFMSGLPDGFFDLVIADPPYFNGPEQRGYYGRKDGGLSKRKMYAVIDKWDVPGEAFFLELKRVSKEQIVWGENYFAHNLGIGRIVWDKVNDKSSFSDCEIAYCSKHDSVRIFRYMWNGCYQGKSALNGTVQQGNKALNQKRIHPTEKPFELYRWLLTNYAKPGQKIFDPMMGSQSSRIAAYDMGFDYWGCELDREYFEQGEARFKAHTAKPTLFAPEQMYNFEQVKLFQD